MRQPGRQLLRGVDRMVRQFQLLGRDVCRPGGKNAQGDARWRNPVHHFVDRAVAAAGQNELGAFLDGGLGQFLRVTPSERGSEPHQDIPFAQDGGDFLHLSFAVGKMTS